jgi:UrcA family protein
MSTYNTSNTSNWLCTLAAIACTLGASATFADPATEGGKEMTVNYADLDLSKPAGVEVLYGRIKMAARNVCSYLESRFEHKVLWRNCYSETVANAIATVDRPTLTALHKASRTARG